jgi:hypothetical protein
LYTIEFYSATKKNEVLSFTGKWMELVWISLMITGMHFPYTCSFFLELSI